MQELSAIRALPSHLDTEGAFDKISTFIKERSEHPLFAAHGAEVGQVIIALLDAARTQVLKDLNDAKAQTELQRGRAVLDELAAINPDWAPRDVLARIDEDLNTVTKRVQQNKDREDLIARLKKLADDPSADAVLKLRVALRAEAAKPTHYDQDPQVKAAENELYKKHLESIQFSDQVDAVASAAYEDRHAGLIVQPLVGRPSVEGPPLFSDRVVLAMARGILYALTENDGEWLWSMRVGEDTRHLPVRVPAFGETPEQVLVLSADTRTLTGVNIRTRTTLWRHPVGAASLGRPVVIATMLSFAPAAARCRRSTWPMAGCCAAVCWDRTFRSAARSSATASSFSLPAMRSASTSSMQPHTPAPRSCTPITNAIRCWHRRSCCRPRTIRAHRVIWC